MVIEGLKMSLNNVFSCMRASCRKKFSARGSLKTLILISSIFVSASTFANVAVWAGFGGAEKNDGASLLCI